VEDWSKWEKGRIRGIADDLVAIYNDDPVVTIELVLFLVVQVSPECENFYVPEFRYSQYEPYPSI
jgi:hypothetical protein